jgi:hypothetical protein
MGDREKTGGRQKGTPNKTTSEIRSIAQKHGRDAICALVKLMRKKDTPPATIVAAAKEILDRAYGKSFQPVQVDPNPDGPGLDDPNPDV